MFRDDPSFEELWPRSTNIAPPATKCRLVPWHCDLDGYREASKHQRQALRILWGGTSGMFVLDTDHATFYQQGNVALEMHLSLLSQVS